MAVAAVTVVILLIPLTASQFTTEVDWSVHDYIIAGMLLLATGGSWVLFNRQTESVMYKLAAGMALFSTLFLIWVNLAVGVVGAESQSFNLLYFGVVLVIILGSLVSRLSASGLSITLFTAAIIQALTIFVALMMDMQSVPGSSILEIVTVNGLFVVLFTISGFLFRQSEELNASQP